MHLLVEKPTSSINPTIAGPQTRPLNRLFRSVSVRKNPSINQSPSISKSYHPPPGKSIGKALGNEFERSVIRWVKGAAHSYGSSYRC